MDANSFNLLPIENKLLLFNKEGTPISTIPSLTDPNHKITIYSYSGFLIEEYRNKETNEFVRIEALNKVDESQRLQFYSAHLKVSCSGIQFKKEEAKVYKGNCINCEYEWFFDGKSKVMDLKCPVCENFKCDVYSPVLCDNCQSTNYKIIISRIYKESLNKTEHCRCLK